MELKQTLKLLMGLMVLCILSKCAPKDSEQKSNFSSTDFQDAQMTIEVFDFTAASKKHIGSSDGLKVHSSDIVFATGPGGCI